MPESKADALARAKRGGYPPENVMKGEKGHYIIPHGIHDPKARRAYIHCRDSGGSSSTCAAVANSLQNADERKKK